MTEVRITSSTGGQKGSKLERYDLIPVGPLAHVARTYGKGAEKYADRNWELGYDWSLSYAAMQRHLNAFWGGEWLDPETGVPHLACAVFHAMALMEYHETHPEFDDRPRVPRPEVEQPPKSMREHLLGGSVRNVREQINTSYNPTQPCTAAECGICWPKGERQFFENQEFH